MEKHVAFCVCVKLYTSTHLVRTGLFGKQMQRQTHVRIDAGESGGSNQVLMEMDLAVWKKSSKWLKWEQDDQRPNKFENRSKPAINAFHNNRTSHIGETIGPPA